ncbi:hypothetical protein ZHAS_00001967 [Anopheles sinensis]|uniref:Uncharacterized protein n=1 Tax=Anopheles sinensis TaxID=74873 RepID=A0A084VBP2_ANOSI|nr:hypothetical protein ZHAS_00001967 [Anopheles sinensis]
MLDHPHRRNVDQHPDSPRANANAGTGIGPKNPPHGRNRSGADEWPHRGAAADAAK